MAKALSVDLRRRVVGAIADGMSCRQAAARFKVSPASAIRWRAQEHRTGDVAPKKQGGDRRSGRIEAQAAFILGEVQETPDSTLTELQAKLQQRGISVGIGTLWRFFDRHHITLEKSRRMQPNSSAPM